MTSAPAADENRDAGFTRFRVDSSHLKGQICTQKSSVRVTPSLTRPNGDSFSRSRGCRVTESGDICNRLQVNSMAGAHGPRRANVDEVKKRVFACARARPESNLYKSVIDRGERHELNRTTIPTNMKVRST